MFGKSEILYHLSNRGRLSDNVAIFGKRERKRRRYRIMKHLVIFAAALFLACSQSWGTLRLPEVITDNMVLQQGKKVCIWGECNPGEKVRLSFRGQKKTAEADYIGRWSIVLDEMEASAAPADMTIRCGRGATRAS